MVGLQQRNGIDCIQHTAIHPSHPFENWPDDGWIRIEQFRNLGRGFHQREPILLVVPTPQEGSNRILRRVIGGDAPLQKALSGGLNTVRPPPARQHPRSALAMSAKPVHCFDHGGGDRRDRDSCVRRVKNEDTVEIALSQQHIQNRGNPVRSSILAEIERVFRRGSSR